MTKHAVIEVTHDDKTGEFCARYANRTTRARDIVAAVADMSGYGWVDLRRSVVLYDDTYYWPQFDDEGRVNALATVKAVRGVQESLSDFRRQHPGAQPWPWPQFESAVMSAYSCPAPDLRQAQRARSFWRSCLSAMAYGLIGALAVLVTQRYGADVLAWFEGTR